MSEDDDELNRLAAVEKWINENRSEGGTASLIIEEAAALVGVMLSYGPMSWTTTARYLNHIYETLNQKRSDVDVLRLVGDIARGDAIVGADPACGTTVGYHRHRTHGEEACLACKRAMAAYERERAKDRPPRVRKRPSRAKPPEEKRPLQPCGTRAAYERHRRKGEPACDACVKAFKEYKRRYNLGLPTTDNDD